MRVVTLDEIRPLVPFATAIEAVRNGLVAFSNGLISLPDPMQILFPGEDDRLIGDCHVKAAQGRNLPYFVIKVAAGFYRNPDLGLPVNNGMVLVMSAMTGEPVALLQDEGWLTQIRTAAAGVLAVSLKPVGPAAVLGLIGTGAQARLQAEMISKCLGISRFAVRGRTDAATSGFCERLSQLGIQARPMRSVQALCHESDIVVTATPTTTPVVTEADVPGGLHIVAVGADSPGKIEIDPAILARADIIATDSHAQCLHHGDFGAAVRARAVSEDADVSFCDILAGKRPDVDFAAAKLSIVDLTGLGVQDLSVANLVVDGLGGVLSR
jgi:ornithine cyclodeaminase